MSSHSVPKHADIAKLWILVRFLAHKANITVGDDSLDHQGGVLLNEK